MVRGPSNAPREDFFEAVAELRPQGTADAVIAWCAEHGIDAVPAAAGALLTGRRQRFEDAFGERLPDRSHSYTLPVPQELQEVVERLTVLPVPHLHHP
ncbi:hypothetical protein [Streptomyces sp. KR80]|uniref:hypothetical protein n=1 Tax=Streptomyces sp. KR80 TaxID=3457426 RepID=UPI003FD686E0